MFFDALNLKMMFIFAAKKMHENKLIVASTGLGAHLKYNPLTHSVTLAYLVMWKRMCILCYFHSSTNPACKANPIAQLIRVLDTGWRTRLRKSRVRGVTCAQCLWDSWQVWLQLVAGHSPLKSVKGLASGGVRIYAYVKHLTLNSVVAKELCDQREEDSPVNAYIIYKCILATHDSSPCRMRTFLLWNWELLLDCQLSRTLLSTAARKWIFSWIVLALLNHQS